jgi:D-alanyl-D-alanine carboxypeptidase/D-alanyl-D-alanine-endopeptidase (penicillin-binding protein 4)
MKLGPSVRLIAVASVVLLGGGGVVAQADDPEVSPASPAPSDTALTDVPGLDQSALDVMNQPAYVNGRWAVAVRDMETGEQIVSLNASTFFEPGSVAKTYSIGAAWQHFGPDSTITTPVKSTGDVADGVLTGNLILVGQGDLTMNGRTKADGTVDYTNLDHNDANGVPGATLTTEDPLTGINQLAAQVKAAGINAIAGDVIVDDRLWDPAELDGQPITPIIVNQNVIDLTTTPTSVGQTASTAMSPVVAPWTIDDRVLTVAAGTPDTGFTARSLDQKTIVLEGTIAEDAGPTLKVLAFDDPATFARTAYIEALARAGVTVTADPTAANPATALPSGAEVAALPSVAALTSLPFLEEATYTMKISYNRGAQTFICRLAVAAGSTDCDDGLAHAREIWDAAGLDTTQAVLIDGSGLPGNMITANNEVQLQTLMATRADAAEWSSTMPLLGIDGSLATVQAGTPAAGKVIGKTGTLALADRFNGRYFLPTKALGGYMETRSGRHFAFTIMVNGSAFADVEGLFAANDDVGKVAASIQQSY